MKIITKRRARPSIYPPSLSPFRWSILKMCGVKDLATHFRNVSGWWNYVSCFRRYLFRNTFRLTQSKYILETCSLAPFKIAWCVSTQSIQVSRERPTTGRRGASLRPSRAHAPQILFPVHSNHSHAWCWQLSATPVSLALGRNANLCDIAISNSLNVHLWTVKATSCKIGFYSKSSTWILSEAKTLLSSLVHQLR